MVRAARGDVSSGALGVLADAAAEEGSSWSLYAGMLRRGAATADVGSKAQLRAESDVLAERDLMDWYAEWNSAERLAASHLPRIPMVFDARALPTTLQWSLEQNTPAQLREGVKRLAEDVQRLGAKRLILFGSGLYDAPDDVLESLAQIPFEEIEISVPEARVDLARLLRALLKGQAKFGLRSLHLVWSTFVREHYAALNLLPELSGLRELTLYGVQTRIHLEYPNRWILNSDAFRFLERMPGLRTLHFAAVGRDEDNTLPFALPSIGTLKKLEKLTLDSGLLLGGSLLTSLTHLRELTIRHCTLSSQAILLLKKLSSLEILRVQGPRFTRPMGLQALLDTAGTFKHLQTLEIDTVRDGERGVLDFSVLGGLPTLRELRLSNWVTPLNEREFQPLKDLSGLELFDFHNVPYEKDNDPLLKQLPALSHLREVSWTARKKWTSGDLKKLAALPQVRVVHLNSEAALTASQREAIESVRISHPHIFWDVTGPHP